MPHDAPVSCHHARSSKSNLSDTPLSLYFNYNYGQYTTLWDRLGGSYRKPNDELFRKELKMAQSEWEKQSKEMERIVKEVEGEDDRQYDPNPVAKKQQ